MTESPGGPCPFGGLRKLRPQPSLLKRCNLGVWNEAQHGVDQPCSFIGNKGNNKIFLGVSRPIGYDNAHRIAAQAVRSIYLQPVSGGTIPRNPMGVRGQEVAGANLKRKGFSIRVEPEHRRRDDGDDPGGCHYKVDADHPGPHSG
jgi:hypothetical protein